MTSSSEVACSAGNEPLCLTTARTSSAACATVLTSSRPSIAADPLIVWALRNSDSITSGAGVAGLGREQCGFHLIQPLHRLVMEGLAQLGVGFWVAAHRSPLSHANIAATSITPISTPSCSMVPTRNSDSVSSAGSGNSPTSAT